MLLEEREAMLQDGGRVVGVESEEDGVYLLALVVGEKHYGATFCCFELISRPISSKEFGRSTYRTVQSYCLVLLHLDVSHRKDSIYLPANLSHRHFYSTSPSLAIPTEDSA